MSHAKVMEEPDGRAKLDHNGPYHDFTLLPRWRRVLHPREEVPVTRQSRDCVRACFVAENTCEIADVRELPSLELRHEPDIVPRALHLLREPLVETLVTF